jgi:glycosyltransferase involved in cell wall biosynthesis
VGRFGVGEVITVTHLISGLRRGGAEQCLLRLVRRMDRSRFSSRVISILPLGPLAQEFTAAKIEVETLNCTGLVDTPRALAQLIRRIRQLKPDLVQTWLYHADMLGAVALLSGWRCRLIWNVRNTDMKSENRLSWQILNSTLARLSRIPDCVISNSQAGIAAHASGGYRPRRWIHIANGWEIPETLPAGNARLALGLHSDDVLIGLVARLAKQKDFSSFLGAVARLDDRNPNLKFVLVGGGVTPDALRLQGPVPERVRSRLIFLGEQSNLEKIWSILDAVTLTSAYGEGMPNCIGEAMAAGLPVIATDVGDTHRLLTKGNWLVPPRSTEALANAWMALASLDPVARRAIGEANQRWIEAHYRLDDMVQKYESLYTDLMQAPSEKTHADDMEKYTIEGVRHAMTQPLNSVVPPV